MTNSGQHRNWTWNLNFRPAGAALAIVIMFALRCHAQTFKVIHAFDVSDGWYPVAGLTIDHAGNLYGATAYGGNGAYNGTVFKLTPHGSDWVLSDLYRFNGRDDGETPEARVVFGPDGKLYGSAISGGAGGYGVVYNLQPPASVCKSASCPWTETVLFPFQVSGTGWEPNGDLAFDVAGNIYGATFYGPGNNCQGEEGCGAIYELMQSGGVWTEQIIHQFTYGSDGEYPTSVTYGKDGNLYGTCQGDPNNQAKPGLVFQFVPSGGSWTEKVIHQFQHIDGDILVGGLIFDPAGNLYGSTVGGGYFDAGTAFELSPSGSDWQFSSLYSFARGGADYPYGPLGALVMDSAGNLYGATGTDGVYGYGAVFKLTPSNGGWTYTSLYDFTGGSDGSFPRNVVMDANGNLYGITTYGGNSACQAGCGVVFEITP